MSKKIVGIIVFLFILIMGSYIVYTNPETRNKVSDLTNQLTGKKNITQEKKAQKIEISKDDIIKLIKENMQTFAVSVNQKDMSNFYNNTAAYWQKRTSAAELNKVFNPFIKAGVDLTALKNMQPIIDKETKVTNKKDLYIVGHYNTKPSVVRFKQTYQYQKNSAWKLVEFFVEIK